MRQTTTYGAYEPASDASVTSHDDVTMTSSPWSYQQQQQQQQVAVDVENSGKMAADISDNVQQQDVDDGTT